MDINDSNWYLSNDLSSNIFVNLKLSLSKYTFVLNDLFLLWTVLYKFYTSRIRNANFRMNSEQILEFWKDWNLLFTFRITKSNFLIFQCLKIEFFSNPVYLFSTKFVRMVKTLELDLNFRFQKVLFWMTKFRSKILVYTNKLLLFYINTNMIYFTRKISNITVWTCV